MTCNDCIHYEVCPLGLAIKGSMGTCFKFKNKADFAEVKHGEWKKVYQNDRGVLVYQCSNCHHLEFGTSEYCICGAKMDGKRGE